MAVFSGKIIKAFFTNPNHDTIQIVYKVGNTLVDHYIAVDYDHPDFRDLIKEHSISRIEKATQANAKK